MSILFALLMFLLVISVRYLVEPRDQPVAEREIAVRAERPLVKREYGFEIPQDYHFHLGHMWAMKQGTDDARVGVDRFTANLMGKIDRIEVLKTDRWVRQGQKLVTLSGEGTTIDLLSPVEGVITAINSDAIRDTNLVTNDPYDNGWIAIVKSPDLKVSQRNLIQGSMVAHWMQNDLSRLKAMLAPSPALAQDGGVPINGLLPRLAPELREKVAKEFFLS
jgi:glycine cleavage system H lipoate-binding protein